MRLKVQSVACGYGAKTVARGIDFELSSGEAMYLLGPNGSGKTTLFKTILGLMPPLEGRISIDGEDTRGWPQRKLAKRLAYVPQAHTPPFPFSVRDVVLTARTAHIDLFGSPTLSDGKIADAAMEAMGLSALAEARYTEISGGERQLVLIARALAQEADFLVMDEPTSNLDFGNQMRVLRRVKELTGRGYGLLITTHMPDHALSCATKVALLRDGALLAQGAPDEVLTEENLQAAYHLALRIADVGGGMRVCVPKSI
jgi:iron complex transport system ATP-binding protein